MLNGKIIEDEYTICLLAWYYGISPMEVFRKKWIQGDVDKAQTYCQKKCADPVDFWRGRYE